MKDFLEIIANDTFIASMAGVMGVFVSFIIGIASYLLGTNININPTILGLKDKVNYIKVSAKIDKILEIKKRILKFNLLFVLYILIVVSFFVAIIVNIFLPFYIGILYIFLLVFYSYIFLRLSYIIVNIIKYNLEIDELYNQLMKKNLE